jgi:ribonuclease-3 family protein
MESNLLNGLSLAYIGDAVYELIIRKYVINLGTTNVNNLHKKVTGYTSGISQSKAMHYFLNNNLLSEEEINVFKRGRNSHIHTKRKNMELKDYLDATGFEALIGYLYLSNQNDRINELVDIIIKNKEVL